ncbi:MAG: hypothetical protein KIC94_12750 [Clostridiales bacterium]|nr:hypothetical protein [Clostridiales bacterium]
MSPVSEAKKQANERYTKKTYDEIKIRVPKGQKEIIKDHAESMNESTNAFINRAIDHTIKLDYEGKNKGVD